MTAVAPVVIACNGLWVGWTGLHDFDEVVDVIPESDPENKSPTAGLLSKQVFLYNENKLCEHRCSELVFDKMC